jgi:hypothetical protein
VHFLQIRDYFCIIEGEEKGRGREVKGKKKGKEKEMEVVITNLCTHTKPQQHETTIKKMYGVG